jgi:hypothetical protein
VLLDVASSKMMFGDFPPKFMMAGLDRARGGPGHEDRLASNR